MTDVTHLLEATNRSDRQAAAELLPLVYDELRKLAAAWLAREKPGQTKLSLIAKALYGKPKLTMPKQARRVRAPRERQGRLALQG